MALPTGLLPTLVLALTAGIATCATLGANLFHRRTRSFGSALRTALLATGRLYPTGVGAV